MGSATVGTLVITGVIVAVLAVFLITIGLRLQRLSFTMGTIIVGLRAIREQTRPLGDVLNGIVGDVSGADEALDGVLAAVGPPPVEPVEPAEVVEVEVAEVMAFAGDGDYADDGDYAEDEHYAEDEYDDEEYDFDEEAAAEQRALAFEVPTRSRRGGSGFAEALARAAPGARR